MKLFSRVFQGDFLPNFKGFPGHFCLFLQGNIWLPRIDLLPVPIHLSFFVLLDILCPLLEKEAAATRQMIRCFSPNKLTDPPPLGYRNKKCNSTARNKFMPGKSASEHNFSGVCCNFRVFQGIFPGEKIQGFSGSFRVSRVCWSPCSRAASGSLGGPWLSREWEGTNIPKISKKPIHLISGNNIKSSAMSPKQITKN